MLQISQLQKSYGSRILFSEVSFSLSKRERVGLVGRNGCGKSTLFKIILESETADSGDVHVPKGYRIGALDQHIHFTETSVIKEACTALPDDQKLEEYRAEALLFGLGFEDSDMNRSPLDFSGGFQLRINLVKALLQEPDLLLLDEPTNYLDIVSLQWLRGFLKTFPGEVLLITHDRLFMDSVTTHTMGIHRGALRKIKGSTPKYYTQLAEAEEIHEKTRANTEKKIKEMQQFVDRFRAKNTKAKQAQSKLKKIEKLSGLEKLMSEAQLGFRFNFKPSPAKTLATINDLSFGYDPKTPLFQGLNFEIKPDERIGIIGKNGYGKTTLLNVLSGQLTGTGMISTHPDTQIGYYQQTNRKRLSPQLTVAEEIGSENPNLSISQVRAICGSMMFSGDDADKKISVLSGGEQGRVLLGKVIAKECNLLLLDEPTNHLDMESIQVMAEEISEFPGGVLFVTHDEELLHRIANKLIVFKNGQAQLFLGSYQEFLEKEGWGETLKKTSTAKNKIDRKELKRKRAGLIQERGKILKPLTKNLEEIEKIILVQEKDLEKLNSTISQLAPGSPEYLEAYKPIGMLQIKIADSYEKMDSLIESIDNIKAKFEEQLEELN